MSEVVHLPSMSPAVKGEFTKQVEARERAERKWALVKEAAKEGERKVLSSVISGGTGLAIGWLETKYSEHAQVVGIPLAGAVGVAAHAAGMFVSGSYAEHLHTLGNAGFAIAGYDMGADLARKAAQGKPAAQNGQTGFQAIPAATGTPPAGTRL